MCIKVFADRKDLLSRSHRHIRFSLVNLTDCEIRFVFWPLWASGRVEPYNDIMMIGRHKLVIQKFKKQLSKRFNIKDIDEFTDYLDIKIKRDKTAGTLKIHQSRY